MSTEGTDIKFTVQISTSDEVVEIKASSDQEGNLTSYQERRKKKDKK